VTAAHSDSQQVLREEILAEARRQSERILKHGRDDAEETVAKARAAAAKEHQDLLQAAKAEAVRRRELALATVPVEAGRRRAARIEEILQSIREETRRRLLARVGFDYREVLTALAAEAIGRMDGHRFVLELASADRQAFGDAWVQEVGRRVAAMRITSAKAAGLMAAAAGPESERAGLEVRLAAEPADIQGGVRIRDVEGRQVWDNSLDARLERLWSAMRRQIAVETSLVGGGKASEES
jgi:vacuolar-type H+-ATPase subunit E/Vma4